MDSNKWKLNQRDWERWSFNFVRFVVAPTLIAFFTALQGGTDWHTATGVAVGTLWGSAIDLARKLAAGSNLPDVVEQQPTQ